MCLTRCERPRNLVGLRSVSGKADRLGGREKRPAIQSLRGCSHPSGASVQQVGRRKQQSGGLAPSSRPARASRSSNLPSHGLLTRPPGGTTPRGRALQHPWAIPNAGDTPRPMFQCCCDSATPEVLRGPALPRVSRRSLRRSGPGPRSRPERRAPATTAKCTFNPAGAQTMYAVRARRSAGVHFSPAAVGHASLSSGWRWRDGEKKGRGKGSNLLLMPGLGHGGKVVVMDTHLKV